MVRRIIGSSLRSRLVVTALAALLLAFGFTQIEWRPADMLPEFSRPYVEIQSEALGLSADEVEAMITTPLEADMLNGTPWVEEIRSTSIPGLSSVVMVFEKDTDIMRARQVVSERLTQVFTLPNVTKSPVMVNPVSSAGRFMTIGLSSDTMSLIEMSVLARWTIVPRLLGVQGVANASIWGERKWQVQVQVDPKRLRDENVTLLQVIKTAGNALWVSPLTFLEASTPGTGGWIETANQRLGVRHVLPIKKAADLAEVMVDGAPSKRLSDVATIVEDHQPLIGDSIVKGEPALTLVIEKFPWANTTDVTKEVEHALALLRPGLTGIEMDSTLFRPATYLGIAGDNLTRAVLAGSLLLAAGLMGFFLNWRCALISAVAVLLSVTAGATVLHLQGVSFDFVMIAGFMLALGIVIDDAIVDVDNIARRLRQARAEGSDKSAATIVLEAAQETRSPLLYATVIMALVALPLVALDGVADAIFEPLVAAYLLSVAVSMFVALTVTPVVCGLLLRNGALRGTESKAAVALRRVYRTLFDWVPRNPLPGMAGILALVVLGGLAASYLRQESLLPNLRETDLVVRLDGSSGASHQAMTQLVTTASERLRALPGVLNVSAHLGRAIMSDKTTNINAGELLVSIDPTAEYDATVSSVKTVLAEYEALSPQVMTYVQAQLREELSGTDESLVVRVYGEDYTIMRQKAEEIRDVLARIDGVDGSSVHVKYPVEAPTLEIEVDIERSRQHGIAPGDVRRAASTMMSGLEVGNLFEAQKVFDVVVFGTPETRHSVTTLEEMLIDKPSGGHVALKEVAHTRIVPAVNEIKRDAVARYVDVAANVSGRDLAAVASDVEGGLRQVSFPLEYRAELMGELAERQNAQQRVASFAVAAAIVILLVLQAFFRKWSLAFIAFFTMPAALTGGAFAVLATTGGVVSLGSIVGFIAVLGIAVRNTILVVGRNRHLEDTGQAFDAALVARATEERAAPILMSAIGTALVFLPIAVLGNIAGLEILQPMATVVLGGLVTSTIFSLVAVPAMCVVCGAAEVEPDLELIDDVSDAVAA